MSPRQHAPHRHNIRRQRRRRGHDDANGNRAGDEADAGRHQRVDPRRGSAEFP